MDLCIPLLSQIADFSGSTPDQSAPRLLMANIYIGDIIQFIQLVDRIREYGWSPSRRPGMSEGHAASIARSD